MEKQHSKIHLEKVVVNVGVGRMRQSQGNFDEKVLPEIMKELAVITGQKPAVRTAKKSVAGFKLRQGDIVGLQVTLRKKLMNDFVQRLIKVALPRVRDFNGINPKNVDRQGNLNIGFREQLVFPEISAEKSQVHFGLQVSVATNAKTRDESIAFLKNYGFPIKI